MSVGVGEALWKSTQLSFELVYQHDQPAWLSHKLQVQTLRTSLILIHTFSSCHCYVDRNGKSSYELARAWGERAFTHTTQLSSSLDGKRNSVLFFIVRQTPRNTRPQAEHPLILSQDNDKLVTAAAMVVFTCNECGESLKKAKVELHYRTKCPRCNVRKKNPAFQIKIIL